jgi:pentatricopeptide repeat protein
MVIKPMKEIKALEEGRCVLQQIINCGWDSYVYEGNCLVDVYVKCGGIEDVHRVFNKMQGFGDIYDQLGNKFVDANLHLHSTFELQELKDVYFMLLSKAFIGRISFMVMGMIKNY